MTNDEDFDDKPPPVPSPVEVASVAIQLCLPGTQFPPTSVLSPSSSLQRHCHHHRQHHHHHRHCHDFNHHHMFTYHESAPCTLHPNMGLHIGIFHHLCTCRDKRLYKVTYFDNPFSFPFLHLSSQYRSSR